MVNVFDKFVTIIKKSDLSPKDKRILILGLGYMECKDLMESNYDW